jgi:hypothetical protein
MRSNVRGFYGSHLSQSSERKAKCPNCKVSNTRTQIKSLCHPPDCAQIRPWQRALRGLRPELGDGGVVQRQKVVLRRLRLHFVPPVQRQDAHAEAHWREAVRVHALLENVHACPFPQVSYYASPRSFVWILIWKSRILVAHPCVMDGGHMACPISPQRYAKSDAKEG